MTDVMISDVLKKISDDLAWRGPNDKVLGHIVLSRAYASYLHDWAMRLILAKDQLEAEREARLILAKDQLETKAAQP